MTTSYIFKAAFTQLGIGHVPDPAPTLDIVDIADNLLIEAGVVTFLSNMTGVCVYEYVGADGLNLQGKFTTTDTTIDQRELCSDGVIYTRASAAALAGLNNLSAEDVNAELVDVLQTDRLPDSYATDGTQPTFAQAVLEILQFLTEKSVSSTTVTVKKPDGATSAMTFTLDSATTPTAITRAS